MKIFKKNLLASSIATSMIAIPSIKFGEGEGGGDGGAGGEGGAGGQGGGIDQNSQAFKDAVNSAAQTMAQTLATEQNAGIQSKNDELLGKMKDLQANAKNFEGVDPTKFKEMMAALDQNEEAKLLADGKLEEVIQRRLDRSTSGHEAALQELQAQLDTALGDTTKYKGKLDSNTIRNEVSKFALESGVLPEALDDIISRAGQVFSVDADGKVVALDANGMILKDNGIEMTPDRFVDGLKKSASYYWGASSGTGAQGSGSGAPIDGSTDKGAQAAAEIIGKGGSFDMDTYRKNRGTGQYAKK